MQRISRDWHAELKKEKIEIEHYIPQSEGEHLTLAYSNMLGVCNGNAKGLKKQMHCDKKKGASLLKKVDPLNKQYMTQLNYFKNGTVFSEDEEIKEDINEILNLNQQNLKENRRLVFEQVKMELKRLHGPNYKGLWKVHHIRNLLEIWRTPENGKLKEYCQVAIHYLTKKLKEIKQQR